MEIIRRARYKVNSRSDGYWYIVFTEMTDEINDKLDVRWVCPVDYWVVGDERYGDVSGSFCWENWIRRVDDDKIAKWLE